jgi:hypothetical protein
MNSLPIAFAALSLGLVCLSCAGVTDISDSEPCKNVGYSIASRTLDCTDDPDLANARYKQFQQGTRCELSDVVPENFDCAIEINTATCDEVAAYGDDLEKWLARSASCSGILNQADGRELGAVNE